MSQTNVNKLRKEYLKIWNSKNSRIPAQAVNTDLSTIRAGHACAMQYRRQALCLIGNESLRNIPERISEYGQLRYGFWQAAEDGLGAKRHKHLKCGVRQDRLGLPLVCY